MLLSHKRKLSMMSADSGPWQPPTAPATQQTIKSKLSKNGQKVRRVPNRSLPSDRVKDRMPPEQYGPCCGDGTKKWGDGKGSNAFGDGISYVCGKCLYELEKPAWLLLGFASEEECSEQIENGVLRVPHAYTYTVRIAHNIVHRV